LGFHAETLLLIQNRLRLRAAINLLIHA
jgi:hypothetical protein